MSNEKEKEKLIERIKDLGSYHESVAQSQAIEAVRDYPDEEKMASARKYLSLHQDRMLMMEGVIQAVQRYFPVEEDSE